MTAWSDYRTCAVCEVQNIPRGIDWSWWIDGRPVHPTLPRRRDGISSCSCGRLPLVTDVEPATLLQRLEAAGISRCPQPDRVRSCPDGGWGCLRPGHAGTVARHRTY